MKYRIEKMDAFRVVGPKLETTWTEENKESFREIPQFWAQQTAQGLIPRLLPLMDTQPTGLMGLSVMDGTGGEKDNRFEYYIAVASTKPTPGGMAEYHVPAGTWAIFECKGPMPTAIQALAQRIMTEWFPNSGYQHANGPDIEMYGEGDQTSPDYLSWVWVPVKKG